MNLVECGNMVMECNPSLEQTIIVESFFVSGPLRFDAYGQKPNLAKWCSTWALFTRICYVHEEEDYVQ